METWKWGCHVTSKRPERITYYRSFVSQNNRMLNCTAEKTWKLLKPPTFHNSYLQSIIYRSVDLLRVCVCVCVCVCVSPISISTPCSDENKGTKVPCILGWPYTEDTWLYCDYFIWCVSCTVVVLTCFVICGWVYVGVFWQSCGCFGNTYNLYRVFYCLYFVFVLFRLCIFILFFLFCLYYCKDYCPRVKTQLQ